MLGPLPMEPLVTPDANSDQILLRVVSQSTPRPNVMYLQFATPPTTLAAPTIPLQYLLAQSSIGIRV